MATLIDAAEYTANEIYEIQQTDKVEGAATGASFGGIGVSNQPHQQLANRTALLYNQQQTDKSNIATLQGQVSSILNTYGAEAFTSSGTFMVPPGVTRLNRVRLWGAGGGGGGSTTGQAPYTGAGGGAGGYCEAFNMAVTPGQNISVTIGAGGSGGLNTTGATGGTGGYSAFNGMTANGGAGGTGWASPSGAGGPGGSATGGTLNATGAPGGGGGSTLNGLGGPGGAACAGGGGGNCGPGTAFPGSVPGGGGGGAGAAISEPGSAGAAGLCVVEWWL